MDKRIKLELEGRSIIKPLEVIEADIKRIEEFRPKSISAELTEINSIKQDNHILLEQLRSRISLVSLKPNLKE